MVVARAGGREDGELFFDGCRVLVLQDERSSTDGRWQRQHGDVNMLMPLNCTLTNGYDGKLKLRLFYGNLKKLLEEGSRLREWQVQRTCSRDEVAHLRHRKGSSASGAK